MAYEPARLCWCNPRRKAPRWISWSRQNPGRRYYACVDAMVSFKLLFFCSVHLSPPLSLISVGAIEQHGGCGFVEWHDDPLPKFWSDLIGDLRDEVRRLRGQGSGAVIEDPTAVVALPEAETGGMGMAMALQDQLKQKNSEIDALKGKYQTAVMLFVVFVVGLVAGKMLL